MSNVLGLLLLVRRRSRFPVLSAFRTIVGNSRVGSLPGKQVKLSQAVDAVLTVA